MEDQTETCFLAGKGNTASTSIALSPVREGPYLHCTPLFCKQKSCGSALALQEEMTICINTCRRMSKANARTEDVPHGLLCYMGC